MEQYFSDKVFFFDSYTDFNIAQQQALSALKTCMFYQQDSILSYEQILDNSVLQISRENEKNSAYCSSL